MAPARMAPSHREMAIEVSSSLHQRRSQVQAEAGTRAKRQGECWHTHASCGDDSSLTDAPFMRSDPLHVNAPIVELRLLSLRAMSPCPDGRLMPAVSVSVESASACQAPKSETLSVAGCWVAERLMDFERDLRKPMLTRRGTWGTGRRTGNLRKWAKLSNCCQTVSIIFRAGRRKQISVVLTRTRRRGGVRKGPA